VVDRAADRCPSCASDLGEEVRAFLCPKCQTVIVLGSAQCPNCSLKFKVKTLRPKEPAGDEKLLMKLIDWGKAPPDQPQEEPRPIEPAQAPAQPETAPASEKIRKLAELRQSITDLMDNRSQMLDRMQKRLDDEKARLSQIGGDQGNAAEKVEEEILALASEMADITMLQAHMDSLSDEISTIMESVDVSNAVKERGLAAKALRVKLNEKERELEELKMKEELLVRREEMVDRKIQGYAEKKRELDKAEEDLKVRLAKLEEERAELERLKAAAVGAGSPSEREEATAQWREEQRRVHERLSGMKSKLTGGTESASAEADLDATISALEQHIAALIVEKSELQAMITEAKAVDEDMRKLLAILDHMLGQLPEETIERFSKSGDFALYEKMLDRFKI
jgi:predicted RNA-binding Zn-ribbon protein involved in translation (DUF1610 family)/chromosome segregation ATPase